MVQTPPLRDRQGYTAVHYAAAYGNRQNLELVRVGPGVRQGAGQGPARSLLLCLDSRATGWLNPLWSLDPGTSRGLLWVESRVICQEYQNLSTSCSVHCSS